MSTPSTATAPLPPHHYGHSYHSSYQTNSSQHSPNDSTLGPPPRLAHPYGSYGNLATNSPRNSTTSARPPPATAATQPSPGMSKPKVQRQPDWREFYKNGVPQEIIVIDDDDSPQPSRSLQHRGGGSAASTAKTGLASEHASKKRRTAADHDAGSNTQLASYSNTNTPRYAGSGSDTISTDRTTSMQTTAPTSLGSHGSGGSGGAYAESGAVGQKRKRATRQATGEHKKLQLRETDAAADPYSNYVAPSKPAKKAKDVPVTIIRDTTLVPQRIDDDDGHFIVAENTPLTSKYQILRLLGQGTFGKVVEAFDRTNNQKCAIKIIRSVQKYRDASKIELRVLSTLAMNDKENRNKCIHFRECFDFRNHICIVTDLLGQSVFDFLKANTFVPFPSSQIQNFARQLLTSVAFLHDLNLIHTDLKPENILLVSSSYQTFTYNKTIPSSSAQVQRTARQRKVLLDTDIRLIDFGSATFDEEYHSTVVSTRHYRAPEIILNLGWSFPCDIWSVGCILVEFFTGDALFQTHDNLEHLAMMEAVCGGKIESKLVRAVLANGKPSSNSAAKYRHLYPSMPYNTYLRRFFKQNRLDYPCKDTTKASRNFVKAMKTLGEIIPPSTPFNKSFLDLLKKIFVYDPNKRITAKEALRHPWFRESIIDDGTEATRIKRERDTSDVGRMPSGFAR